MSGFRKHHVCYRYIEVHLSKLEFNFTETKTTLCKKLFLVVLTTMANNIIISSINFGTFGPHLIKLMFSNPRNKGY